MDPLSSPEHAPPPDAAPRVVGFVTGKLAEPALRRVLERLAPEVDFTPRVLRLEIAVAALLTTDWIARKIQLPDDVAELVLPGFCRGDPSIIRDATGVDSIRLGPKDLRDLPEFYGRRAPEADGYGAHDIEIVAEINHVPSLTPEETLAAAQSYRASGADIIDLGCDPDGPFLEIADRARLLREHGLRVSVDTLDPREFRPAVEDGGAELILSVRSDNVDAALDLDAELVVIPDEPATLAGLDATVARLEDAGARYRIDPVLEPIGFGFARSLGRYLDTRDRYPDAEMLMGIGNLTELTDADSAPINVLLLGFCQELGIRQVLTTEVIHWARTSVRECDLARRLVHFACARGSLPKHVEPGLHVLRDPRSRTHGLEMIEALARSLRDRNYRIFAEDGEIHVVSRDLHLRGDDPFELFERMDVPDASHAFYLGFEMSKALTALTLGKDYEQDRALRWGFLTREEESHLDRTRREPPR